VTAGRDVVISPGRIIGSVAGRGYALSVNLLMGRHLQRAYGQPEQAILTMPILVGTDGSRKMSKSLGNHIGITDEPGEMYGKTMSIPDEAMGEYYTLLLGRALEPGLPGREAKRTLAREIVAWLHSPAAAEEAERQFDRVFVQRDAPERIDELVFDASNGPRDRARSDLGTCLRNGC
jgi:tyrosyl-tRNA synthetase